MCFRILFDMLLDMHNIPADDCIGCDIVLLLKLWWNVYVAKGILSSDGDSVRCQVVNDDILSKYYHVVALTYVYKDSTSQSQKKCVG